MFPKTTSALFLIVCLPALSSAADPKEEFFEQKIRPALVAHCYKCHADQGKEPKGGLRVDSREALLKGGDTGTALVPGDPAKSLLIEVVEYGNVDMQMPPKGKLPQAVIDDLKRWVKDGAVWPGKVAAAGPTVKEFDLKERVARHWAWKPVNEPAVPIVTLMKSSPVDAFLADARRKANLPPAPAADRRSLLRRATYLLTGLPPTPELADRFLRDGSTMTLESLTDELLASPQYGERWTRHWLDLVRYGESRGHEFDPHIPNPSQYRDYVIRAFNEDVPFDRFAFEHIAGDLVARPRTGIKPGSPDVEFNESILGTGFWFLGEEVHSPVDIRQDQADRLDNRIDVFSKTFLGLTVSCARCHDHKFDAITTRDYYSLFAALQASTHRLVRFDSLEHNRDLARKLREAREAFGPKLTAEMQTQLADFNRDLPAYLAAVAKTAPERSAPLDAKMLARVEGWMKEAAKDPYSPFHISAATPTNKSVETVVVDYALGKPGEFLPDEGAFGPSPLPRGWVRMVGDEVRIETRTAASYDRIWDGIRNAAGSQVEMGALGYDRAGRTIRTPVFRPEPGQSAWLLVRGSAKVYAAVCGHSILAGPLHGGLVAGLGESPGYRWEHIDLSKYPSLPVHLELTPNKASDFALARVVLSDKMPPLPASASPATIPARFAKLSESPETIDWILKHPDILADGGASMKALLAAHLTTEKALRAELRAESRLSMAMFDGPRMADAVFVRGNPKTPGEKVLPRLPEALPGYSGPTMPGSGRYEMAMHATDPTKNPFLARVMVNRVWHHLFGRGLSTAVDNFGELGEVPTHPELLDYLAAEFVRDGWSVKRLIRRLMLTQAWQMASTADAATLAADPLNRGYTRYPLKRLEGEAIRDAMLMVSGRLDPTMFGRSVPIHLTEFLDGRGRPASGPLDGNGRRSLYLATQRNFLSPMLLAFDTPLPFSTMGRRNVSTVPAQSLMLMNDPLVHQLAGLWAKKVLATPGSTPERISRLYYAALTRQPTPAELQACVEYIEAQSLETKKSSGDPELWKGLAHSLFCLKEFIYLD